MILVVDHYDSFTYNLVQLIEGLGRTTEVVKSDGASAEPSSSLASRRPSCSLPDPATPGTPGSFPELLRLLPERIPVLGVCLGHQALGIASGGTVDRTTPFHGKASLVHHEGRGILDGRRRARSRRAATTPSSCSATTCPRSSSSRHGPRTAS